MTEFPEPRGDEADPGVLLARYLDFYRETVVRKVRSLPVADQRASRLPSGWTPLEMLATSTSWSGAGSSGASSARTSTTCGARTRRPATAGRCHRS